MLLRRTVTRDPSGDILFETRYSHDTHGRLLTSEWIVKGSASGPVTRRSYDLHNHVVALITNDPDNRLLCVQMTAYDEKQRLSFRATFDGNGHLIGRIEYRWDELGVASGYAYDKDGNPQGRFRLMTTAGPLYDMEWAGGTADEAGTGPVSIRHFYTGTVIGRTEIQYPPGLRVAKRTLTYEHGEGILTRIRTSDEPSGNSTDVELEWTDGQASVDSQTEFLLDFHQQ